MSFKDYFLKKYRRDFELQQIAEAEKEFDEAVKAKFIKDSQYLRDDDKELTPEQIAEIDAFWKKYEFAFKPNYVTYKAFYNRTGICDPRYLPFGTRSFFLNEPMKVADYRLAFQNKAYLTKTYLGIKQPEVVCRKVEGLYYDADFKHITESEAISLCEKTLERVEIVIKPSGKNGGKGVVFLKEGTFELIKSEFDKIPKLMVVQEALKQHPKMAELNPSTVNTVRLTTYLHDGEVKPLAALIKIGNAGVRVDNYKHGGHILGVDVKTGKTQHYAMNVALERVTTLPTGIDLSNGIEIPGFDSVIETAKNAHILTPQMKLISWDIGINENAEAVIIEANFSGDFRMHHATTGPVFGDLTEDLLDRYIVKAFYRKRANRDYNFNEYFNHIEITKYAGDKAHVIIPNEINGKPVKVIGEKAFLKNSKVKTIVLPDSVNTIRKAAFKNCNNLKSVEGGKGLKKISGSAFRNCPKMDKNQLKNFRKLK